MRAIRLVLPFPPGGGTDTLGRILGQRLNEALGQPVMIENRPGAGGNIGSELVAKALPDGYTLLLATTSVAISPTLYRKLSYDPMRDLIPVAMAAEIPTMFVVADGGPTPAYVRQLYSELPLAQLYGELPLAMKRLHEVQGSVYWMLSHPNEAADVLAEWFNQTM